MIEQAMIADGPRGFPAVERVSTPQFAAATLSVLLVVAWIVSGMVHQFGMVLPWPRLHHEIESGYGQQKMAAYFDQGSVALLWANADIAQEGFFAYQHQRYEFTSAGWLGTLFLHGVGLPGTSFVAFPIPVLLTVLLPFAIAPFIRFRFPLWSYFAFTALIAAELAFYLR